MIGQLASVYAVDLLMENTSGEMSPVACFQKRVRWMAENQKDSLESPLERPNMPNW